MKKEYLVPESTMLLMAEYEQPLCASTTTELAEWEERTDLGGLDWTYNN